MKSRILVRNGEQISTELTVNGRRRLAVRFWDPLNDATLGVDTADILAASQRDRLVSKLPLKSQAEAADQLLDLANEITDLRQNGRPLTPEGPTTLQPSLVRTPEQQLEDWNRCEALARAPHV